MKPGLIFGMVKKKADTSTSEKSQRLICAIGGSKFLFVWGFPPYSFGGRGGYCALKEMLVLIETL